MSETSEFGQMYRDASLFATDSSMANQYSQLLCP